MALPFRDAERVLVTTPVEVPCCNRCGELLLGAADAARLDRALEADYRAQRHAALVDDLRAILADHGLRQCDIEALCGVSVGYVSKILRSEKPASPLLLRLVHLLRVDPHATIRGIGDAAVLPPTARRFLSPNPGTA